MSGLEDLAGVRYGPFPVAVTSDRAESFARATADDSGIGAAIAPPMFSNVALFAAAPAFLEDDRVAPFTRSLIHSEQEYEWARPLVVGEQLEVEGAVDSVRVRGSLNLVSFSCSAHSADGPWFTGSSVFAMSTEAAASVEDLGEPDPGDRPAVDGVGGRLPLPAVGEPLVPRRCGASRDDLGAYAAASGDMNPIHLDHEAAMAAGLGGTIVHGLLMAAWIAGHASRYGPLRSIRLRFRKPLRPGVAATVTGAVAGVDVEGASLDLGLDTTERLVTARARVTP